MHSLQPMLTDCDCERKVLRIEMLCHILLPCTPLLAFSTFTFTTLTSSTVDAKWLDSFNF